MDFQNLWSQLSFKGYKMTYTRRKILQILTEDSGWLTAKALYEELLTQQVKINFSTVCRNLDMLYSMGVLCRVDHQRNGVFVYRWRDMGDHHHHLICLACGKIQPMQFCPLHGLDLNQTGGFSELECQFEVYGYCQDCQASP